MSAFGFLKNRVIGQLYNVYFFRGAQIMMMPVSFVLQIAAVVGIYLVNETFEVKLLYVGMVTVIGLFLTVAYGAWDYAVHGTRKIECITAWRADPNNLFTAAELEAMALVMDRLGMEHPKDFDVAMRFLRSWADRSEMSAALQGNMAG